MDTNDAQRKAQAEALIPQFQLERVLNQDQMGRRITLLGSISQKPALITIERAALPTDTREVARFLARLTSIQNLQWNDIYHWYLSSLTPSPTQTAPDLKLNLIYPCDSKHIQKYSSQPIRMVTETPQIYTQHIRPYMSRYRDQGRLNWIFNILDGKTEQEDIILRHPPSPSHSAATPQQTQHDTNENNTGFILLPDLNWDRHTLTNLHLLAIPTRRDLWSLRDLRVTHLPYLISMRHHILEAITSLYHHHPASSDKTGIEADQLKLYLHYHPTYYHLHIHVVHVQCEAGPTQSVGKAFGLENVIAQLELLKGLESEVEVEEEERGMHQLDLTYYVGEASELWETIFKPLKMGGQPAAI